MTINKALLPVAGIMTAALMVPVLALPPLLFPVSAGSYALYAALSAVCLFMGVLVLLDWLIYRRLRLIHLKLRQILGREISPAAPDDLTGPDTIKNLYDDILDISRTIRTELRQMKELDLFRKEFIGDVSHELKTPIFSIEGYLETLLDGALEDKKVNRKFIEQALKNVHRLNSLVQDLLIISQLESGEMEMFMEQFRVYDLILDVIDLHEARLKASGRSVQVRLKPNNLEGCYVMADKDRIKQVLSNLVSNAITYGRDENAELTVELSGDNGKLWVHVADNGTGIPAEHLPYIFERFYRVDKSRSREKGGTGLGLSIVKNLLKAHNETITVKSTPGQGSVFSFSLQKVKA